MRFWSGFAAGVTTTLGFLSLLYARWVTGTQRDLYRDFGGTLPVVSELVLSPFWAWGVPIALLVAVLSSIGVGKDRARFALLVTTAVLAVGALAFTAWVTCLPLFELAGDVRAE